VIRQTNRNLSPKFDAFDYQEQAVDFIKNLEYGGIFHEQGLGKSKIAIDLILYWLKNDIVDVVILVAKKGLVENWKRELSSHSFLTPRVINSDIKNNFHTFTSSNKVILTHYEAIKFERERVELFIKSRRVAIILDEATKIKNPGAELSSIFHELAPLFSKRIILTGTPVANRPYDLWSQIYFLDLGKSLGDDFEAFRKLHNLDNKLGDKPDGRTYVISNSSNQGREDFENAISSIQKKISGFSIRENKQSKYVKLPEKIIKNIITDWEAAQKLLYEKYRDELGATISKNGEELDDDAEEIIKRLLRLVQIASNPALVDDSYTNQPGKLKALLELVHEIISKNEKLIIWSLFTDNVNYLANILKEFNTVRIHGKLSMEERNNSVDKFLGVPDCKILIATPGAAKEGLTLTVANHAIFFDRGFSLDDYLQAQDRIHRVSQSKICYVYNLIMRDSVDEWLDDLLEAKKLAAQLAQGDISLAEYRSKATYSFAELLHKVLNINKLEKK